MNYSDHVQRDLIDALLRAKRSAENNNTSEISAESVGLSDDHILMTVGDIFGAGVETTTTVLKWAITYLIHHPEVRLDQQQWRGFQRCLMKTTLLLLSVCGLKL